MFFVAVSLLSLSLENGVQKNNMPISISPQNRRTSTTATTRKDKTL